MNQKLILPAAFALTLHAFLLFGLTGKTPPAVAAAEDLLPKEKPRDIVSIDTDDIFQKPVYGEDEPTKGPVDTMPRLREIPVVNPPAGSFTVPPLPPSTGIHPVKIIDVNWQEPGRQGTKSAVEVFDRSMLDRIPRARSQPAPIYPNDLRQAGIGGTVVVEFKVDLEGNVYGAKVLSATHSGFVDAALLAIERWKFEPGLRTGTRVRFSMSVPLVFKIDNT
jgi:TonB family protein